MNRWRRQLDELRSRNRLRTLRSPSGVDLSSNDYLGYARFASGTSLRSATAARLLRGHHAIWEEVETELARWHGVESALIFTSGYAANEGLLSTAIQRGDWVASHAGNHASIVDGLRLSGAQKFLYDDLDRLEEGLRSVPSCERFIVTESLFGMSGEVAPLPEIVALAERYGAHVIVDEAHATGCFGSCLVDSLGLRSRVLATVHTGGKALGVMGAYVAGSALLRELLINRCRHFMFTTALPSALGQWWKEALERVRVDAAGRDALHRAAAHFRSELERVGVEAGGNHYIVSLVVGEDAVALDAAARLQSRGWDIRAIRPPTVPEGTARLRISVHADHSLALLTEVAEGLAEVMVRA